MSPQQKSAVSISKRLLLLIIFGAASIFLIKGIYSLGMAQSQESPNDERKFKVTEFKDMPLEVKVKNLQSKSWHRDLEVEVKNVSKRPIYFILAYLTFPDDKAPSSVDEVGFSLHYGKPENIMISHLADPQDLHLDPDEKYIFSLPEPVRRGFEARHKKYPGLDKNLQFRITLVSFGDGTGWEAGELRDKRKQSSLLGTSGEQPLKKSDQIVWVPWILESCQTPLRKVSVDFWHTRSPRRKANVGVATVVPPG